MEGGGGHRATEPYILGFRERRDTPIYSELNIQEPGLHGNNPSVSNFGNMLATTYFHWNIWSGRPVSTTNSKRVENPRIVLQKIRCLNFFERECGLRGAGPAPKRASNLQPEQSKKKKKKKRKQTKTKNGSKRSRRGWGSTLEPRNFVQEKGAMKFHPAS